MLNVERFLSLDALLLVASGSLFATLTSINYQTTERLKISNNTNTSKQNPVLDRIRPWHIGVLIVLILIGCAYYSTKVMMDNATAKPLKVFQEAYLNDPADVQILNSGGAGGGYFDIWLVFKALKPIELRQANKFKTQYCEAARSWFINKFPNDPDLKRSQDMKLMACSEHNSATEIINEWSLSNEKTGKYYFRTWGVK